MDTTSTKPQERMDVRVRDRAAEAPWGHGLTSPIVRTISIGAYCPECGERRGTPQGLNECDDGAFYSVSIWSNPCGHVDMYDDVLAEARALASEATP